MKPEVSCWQHPPSRLALKDGELHLWRFSLDAPPEMIQYLQSLLSTNEMVRAERLIDPLKRHSFVMARSCLRKILAKYLGLNPELLKFGYNSSGKPFLSSPTKDKLTFNLSHSGSMAILAVAMDGEVGVDIEKIDAALNFQSVACRYFTLMEINELEKLSILRRRRQFYRLWTRKEAVLKMYGTGFSLPGSIETFVSDLDHCTLINIFLATSYVSALAVNRRITSIQKFNMLPDREIR